jgi:hypothetical protein
MRSVGFATAVTAGDCRLLEPRNKPEEEAWKMNP